MGQVISIGKQDYVSLRENHYFYIDKTDFIRQWWKNADDITLITRPRRFGKTLNMSMLNCFFSRQYAERGDLFEGLSIWEEEKKCLTAGRNAHLAEPFQMEKAIAAIAEHCKK